MISTAPPYVVSPPIAVRRIDRYDGKRVISHYRSHRTERVEQETVDVLTFIGRMVQHTVPKGFKRIRYYGVQASKTFAKVKVVIQAALAKVEGVVTGAVKIIARLTYRQRYKQRTGRDPLRCPHCQNEREVWCIWHLTYGVIYDEGGGNQRGHIRLKRPTGRPLSRGLPLKSPPEGRYVHRSNAVWSRQLLLSFPVQRS
jgi:hypothetical protein